MNLSKGQLWALFIMLFVGGVTIGLGLGREFQPDPALVEVHHTDTIYVGYVDLLSVDGKEKQIERDYGFDRIFPTYHYKIIRVSGLCGASYDYDSYYHYSEQRQCGFEYFDKDIKGSDKATLNIYQCYDTTYDTTCYKLEDCGGKR